MIKLSEDCKSRPEASIFFVKRINKVYVIIEINIKNGAANRR